MYKEETSSSNLAKFLANFDYMFVDTCSLMDENFPLFMDKLVLAHEYWHDETKAYILAECLNELEKNRHEKDNSDARIDAKRALKILKQDQKEKKNKIFDVYPQADERGFADRALYSLVASLRGDKKILIITQDKKLSDDLNGLNNLKSQNGRYLKVYRLKNGGDLELNPGEEEKSSDNNHQRTKKNTKENSKTAPIAISTLCSKEQRILSLIHNVHLSKKERLQALDAYINEYDNLSPYLRSFLKKDRAALLQEKEELKKKSEIPVAVLVSMRSGRDMPPRALTNPEILKSEDSSLERLFTRVASSLGIIVRDDSVPYLPTVHGPLNVTKTRFEKGVSALKNFIGEKKFITLPYEVIYSFDGKTYHLTINKVLIISKTNVKNMPKKVQALPKKTKKISDALLEAQKNEQNLDCNLPNSNYSISNKVADLEAQIKLVRTLKPSEQQKLKHKIRNLNVLLKEYKTKDK